MSRRRLAMFWLLLGLMPVALVANPVAYDEAVDGDLPEIATEKTFELGLGTNTIIGEIGFRYGMVGIDFPDFDSFTFVVSEGLKLFGGQLEATETSGEPLAAEWRITGGLIDVPVWASSFPANVSIPSLGAGTYKMQQEGYAFVDTGVDALVAYRFELIVAQEGSVVVTNLAAMPNPVAVQATLDLTAKAWGSGNIQSAAWTLNRAGEVIATGVMDPEDGTFDTPMEKLRARDLIAPYAAGIYDLCVTATDVNANTSENTCIDLVVYDPSGGFVTGGGWIWSPPGAMAADPEITGRANFGFVSRYRRGANIPDGSTQFVFQAGDLNFRSNTYEWLVVTGSGYARFKGTGTINGANAETGKPYQFMIWAGDGDPDTFRIMIWYEEGGEVPVYDNGMHQPIGGGQIVVHTGGRQR